MTTKVEGDVEIPDELLARCYRSLVFDDLNWEALFSIFGIVPLDLSYDDIVADLPRCIQRIAGKAGVDLPEVAATALSDRAALVKQSTDLNAKLVARLSNVRIEAFGPGNILHDTGVLFD